MSDNGFIKLNRCEDTLELLLKEPNAFLLLCLIAYRARRNDKFNVKNLGPGEALIGDDGSCGLTTQMYRTAKEKLAEWNFVTFKTTNKGTVAKMIDTRVWDINCDDAIRQNNNQTTDKEQASNRPATPNEERKNERNSVSKDTSSVATSPSTAAAPPPADFSISKQTVIEALISKGITKLKDHKQLFKSWGTQKVWFGLQHIFSPGFEIQSTPIQCLNWACKIEAWDKPGLKPKQKPREIIEATFVDGKKYNGYTCGLDRYGIWFTSGPNHCRGAKYENSTFSATFAAICEDLAIQNPLKKTFDIKEA